jgi:hypothetical protein
MKIKKEVAIGIAIGAIAAACSIVSTIIAVNNRPQEGVSGSDDSSVEKLVKKAQALIDEGKNPLFNLDKYNKKKG